MDRVTPDGPVAHYHAQPQLDFTPSNRALAWDQVLKFLRDKA